MAPAPALAHFGETRQYYVRYHGNSGQYIQPHFRQIGHRGFYTLVGAWCIVS